MFDGFREEIIRLADGEAVETEQSTDLSILGDDDEDDTTIVSDPVTEARNQRDQAIEGILLDTFDSERYDTLFAEQLESVQKQIIRSAELEESDLLRDKGEITFNMRSLYGPIYEELRANELTAEITQNEVPADYGIFPVADRETTADFLWSLLRNGSRWRTLTLAGAVFSLIGALVIAERRPSTAIQFGSGMFGTGLVVVVIIFLIRFIVPILASGSTSAGPVVSTYVANTSPLLSIMYRLMALGVGLAFLGWIARLIWPDDWVYSHVSDERGVRSIQRRRGAPEPQAQVPVAAAVPVGYPPYGQPYGYQPGWQPYPGQPYPPAGAYPYPVGPYAQPAQAAPQHYNNPGHPTVPVMPVAAEGDPTTGAPAIEPGQMPGQVPGPHPDGPAATASPGVVPGLPADAAQAVPRVVATTGEPGSAEVEMPAPQPVGDGEPASDTPPPTGAVPETASAPDEWSTEQDW